ERRGHAPPPHGESEPAEVASDADFAEIYVNIGRRDGARAADYQRLLTERAGIDRAHVRRIRVRERNAFVSVRRDDLEKGLAALTGATIAGKPALAEQAGERGGEAEPSSEAAHSAERPDAPADDPAPATDRGSPPVEPFREGADAGHE